MSNQGSRSRANQPEGVHANCDVRRAEKVAAAANIAGA
jgi:hypothetical protein